MTATTPELRLLGAIELVHDGRPVRLGGPMERALLACLALRVGEFVATDALVELLWPADQPVTAAKTLRSYVSRLRRRLQPDARAGARDAIIERMPGGYRLVLPRPAIDVHQFEALLGDGQRALTDAEPRLASIRLRAALKLWRGDPFGDLRYEPFAAAEAERLEERRAAAIEMVTQAEMALGHHDAVIEPLRELVAADPLRETAWRGLIEALYRAGRRAQALEHFEVARRTLTDELGVEPGDELQALARAIREDALPPLVHRGSGRAVPQPLTATIGRVRELRTLEQLIRRKGLLTLIGPAGSGKTRLALELARQHQHEIGPGGVAWIELAAVSDRAGVIKAMAHAVGTPDAGDSDEVTRVVAELSPHPPLLVLDNCEHLIDACRALSQSLLEECPGLTIVATSREALGVPGERTFAVSPLRLPPPQARDHAAISASPAVQLLVARAGDAKPGFAIDRRNATALAAIAERLDGLPLAIELAAVRLRALSPADLLVRLNDRFRLAAAGGASDPPHHQTLQAAIAWSYDRLSEPEQIVLRRLSTFQGTFALPQAEVVCGIDPIGRADVAGLLARLVDRSMVQVDAGETARYRLLETVRAYVAQEAARTESEDDLRRRHRDAYLALAERTAPWLRGPRLEAALRQLDADLPNLRAALAWSMASPGEARIGLRLATRVWRYWQKRGLFLEGLSWLDDGLRLADDASQREEAEAQVAASWLQQMTSGREDRRVIQRAEHAAHVARHIGDPELEGWALLIAALGHSFSGAYARARRLAHRALTVLEPAGDLEGVATVRASLGMAAKYTDRLDEARDHFEEALADYERLGDPWDSGWALVNLSDIAIRTGNGTDAVRLARMALSRLQASWDSRSISTARLTLGDALQITGDLASAEEAYRGALRIAERKDLKVIMAEALVGMAELALHRGDAAGAARLASRVEGAYRLPDNRYSKVRFSKLSNRLNALKEVTTMGAPDSGFAILQET